jgi:hypothetical protein
MRSRLTSSLSAVAAASLLYSVYSIAADPNGTLSSPPCGLPTIAVDFYAQGLPQFPRVNESAPEDTRLKVCDDACRRWRGTCRGVVRTTRKCLNSWTAKSFAVFGETCKAESELQQCRVAVRQELRAFKNFSKADAQVAEGCCNDLQSYCFSACLLGDAFNESTIPLCSELGPIGGCGPV